MTGNFNSAVKRSLETTESVRASRNFEPRTVESTMYVEMMKGLKRVTRSTLLLELKAILGGLHKLEMIRSTEHTVELK